MISLKTPSLPPWTIRQHAVSDSDPRDPFARDRDRVLHSAAFRRLQHKTQVYIVSEGDYYRTRITHSLEVAQVARSLARMFELSEDLAEAISLAHDVGHTPFGHAGERALNDILKARGVTDGWNSNTHSLYVFDELEFEAPAYRGMNLTFATRQGIARHRTPFDDPDTGFDAFPQPTLEAQVVNVADIIAYAGHDVEAAIYGGLLSDSEVTSVPSLALWGEALEMARKEFKDAGEQEPFDGERRRRLVQRARRHFINRAIRDAWTQSQANIQDSKAHLQAEAVRLPEPLVSFSAQFESGLKKLLGYLKDHIYHGSITARQNFKEEYVLRELFLALDSEVGAKLLPGYYEDRWVTGESAQSRAKVIAYFLTSLSDRAVMDLYAELFDPRERVMLRRY